MEINTAMYKTRKQYISLSHSVEKKENVNWDWNIRSDVSQYGQIPSSSPIPICTTYDKVDTMVIPQIIHSNIAKWATSQFQRCFFIFCVILSKSSWLIMQCWHLHLRIETRPAENMDQVDATHKYYKIGKTRVLSILCELLNNLDNVGGMQSI